MKSLSLIEWIVILSIVGTTVLLVAGFVENGKNSQKQALFASDFGYGKVITITPFGYNSLGLRYVLESDNGDRIVVMDHDNLPVSIGDKWTIRAYGRQIVLDERIK